MTQIEDEDDWPICEHDSHEVMVTNQPGEYDKDRPHRAASVCARPKCVRDAMRWVAEGTGEPAYWKLWASETFSDTRYPKEKKLSKKKSKHKAAKIQRAYDNRERSYPKPDGIVEEAIRSLDRYPDDQLQPGYMDQDVAMGSFVPSPQEWPQVSEGFTGVTAEWLVQPRWEIERWTVGDEAHGRIIDHLTGFVANYEAVDLDDIEEGLASLLSGKSTIGDFMWFLPTIGAYVVKVHESTEHQRFWGVIHEQAGIAVFDRGTGMVHPIDDEWSEESDIALHAEVDIWNRESGAQFDECEELSAVDGVSHWNDPNEWVAEPPEDVAEAFEELATEPPAVAPLADDPDRLRVLVVSSSQWTHTAIATDLIQHLWGAAGDPPLTILTSGSPHGAEGVARRLAENTEGVLYEQIDDRFVTPDKVDYAFAFIANDSEGATAALNRLLVLGIPTHVLTETSALVPEDPWLAR